jgi:hypothetical protein
MMNGIQNCVKRCGTLIVFVLISLLPVSAQTEGNLTLVNYYCQRGEFTIGLPENWEKEEQDVGQGIWMLLVSSPNEPPNDFFSENINVVIVPADTSSLRDANAKGINMLKQNTIQFQLLDQGLSKMGVNDVAWFIHTNNYQGHTIKVLKVTIINRNKMYLVTCTALPITFDHYRPVFDQIVSSIKFDEPKAGTSMPPGNSPPTGNPSDVAYKLGALTGGLLGAFFLVRSFLKKKK